MLLNYSPVRLLACYHRAAAAAHRTFPRHMLLTPSCPGKGAKPQRLYFTTRLVQPLFYRSCLLYVWTNERGRLGASPAQAKHPAAPCSWNSKF